MRTLHLRACCGRWSRSQSSALSPDEGSWSRCVTLDSGSYRHSQSFRHFGNLKTYHQTKHQLELPSGIEPNYLDYKSSASPAMLWKQIMYQFHTGLLGTIRVSRTRCTTQSAIMCYQLLGFHHEELVNGGRTHLIDVCLHLLSLHI